MVLHYQRLIGLMVLLVEALELISKICKCGTQLQFAIIWAYPKPLILSTIESRKYQYKRLINHLNGLKGLPEAY